jgi:hypothetical protein
LSDDRLQRVVATPLFRMRPRTVLLFYQVTKAIPLHLPSREGAAEPDFAIAQADHLPVSPPGATFDEDPMADLQRVWLENQIRRLGSLSVGRGDVVIGHDAYSCHCGCVWLNPGFVVA